MPVVSEFAMATKLRAPPTRRATWLGVNPKATAAAFDRGLELQPDEDLQLAFVAGFRAGTVDEMTRA
jgi:hypothetical protein